MVLTRVFAYILLFVIKCRFPASLSVADIIRKRYDENVLSKVRRLPYLLKLKESIFINKLCPELNGTETSVPLDLFKQ